MQFFLSTLLCGAMLLTSCGFGTNQGSAFDSLTDSENEEEDEDSRPSSGPALSQELCEEHKTCRGACQRIYHQVHAQLHCEALTVGEVSSLQKLFTALTTGDPLQQAKLLLQSPARVWDLYLQAGLSGLTDHVSAMLDLYPHSQKNYRNILKRLTSDKELTSLLKDKDPHHEVLKQLLLGSTYPPSLRKRVLTQSPSGGTGTGGRTPFCQPAGSLKDCRSLKASQALHLCGCRSNDLYLHKGVLSYKLSTVQTPKTLSPISPENQDLLVALSFTAPASAGGFVPPAGDTVPSARGAAPSTRGSAAPSADEDQSSSFQGTTTGPFNLFLFTSSDSGRFQAFALAHSLVEEACGTTGPGGGEAQSSQAEETLSQTEQSQSQAGGSGHSSFRKQQQCIAGFYCWLKDLRASPLHQLLNSPQVEDLFSPEALHLIRGDMADSSSDDCRGF